MPKFPTRQIDIRILAYTFAVGVLNHSDDFPNIDVFEIVSAINLYVSARDAQNQAGAVAKLATEAKNVSLKNLKDIMKKCLKKSEVDVADAPEKLEYIGWGPKALPTPADLPGQPVNLCTIAEGQGTVRLKWDSPAGDSGGPVRNYIIESRQQPAGGEFGPWQIAGTFLNNEVNLKNQPTGVQLEYHVKAINTGGESIPSNTAAVVL